MTEAVGGLDVSGILNVFKPSLNELEQLRALLLRTNVEDEHHPHNEI
jgi:hypothetical protein